MDNIVDINFNFVMFDDSISRSLKNYNEAKEMYCEGIETDKGVIQKGEAIVDALYICTELMEYRLMLINQNYIKDKFHNKQQLKTESVYLNKKLNWYKKLRASIKEECNKISIGEFGFEDEPDINE